MSCLKVTVSNNYLPHIIESFYCIRVDISDPDEVEMCADECCGNYLDMHHDIIIANCPDIASEELAEACYYIIEEVSEDELKHF